MKKLTTKLVLFSTFSAIAIGAIAQNGNTKSNVQANEPVNTAISSRATEYCIPSANCKYDDGISDFSFAGISNNGSGCSDNGYGDFTKSSGKAMVEIGKTYKASIKSNYESQRASIWIDFNNDKEFNSNELVLKDFKFGKTLATADIVIPSSATPGVVRMRIGAAYNANTSNNSCAKLQYGEWEDYLVEITGESTGVNPVKRVICEEGTGAWCGWCVRGHVYMGQMKEKYPDTWIGIAIHSGDPMANTVYIDGTGFTGFPSATIARKGDVQLSSLESKYLEEVNIAAPAAINIANISYNASTKEVSFEVEATFTSAASNYKLNAVIVEDDVTGTSSDYNQANYYSGGGYGAMGGYEKLPNPVLAKDMKYQDVARVLLGDYSGVNGSLPSSIVANKTYSHKFTTTLKNGWNADNMEIVGMLINSASGKIENGAKKHLVSRVKQASGTEMAKTQALLVYPNPASSILNISNLNKSDISIYNTNGSLVLYKTQLEGNIQLDVSDFEPGMYFLKTANNKGNTVTKINISK